MGGCGKVGLWVEGVMVWENGEIIGVGRGGGGCWNG